MGTQESPVFEIVDGPQKGKQITIPLTGGAIGQNPMCGIILNGPGVEDYHCQLSCEGDSVILKDLASRAGTLVNGKPVHQQALKHGDLITIGECRLRFVAPEGLFAERRPVSAVVATAAKTPVLAPTAPLADTPAQTVPSQQTNSSNVKQGELKATESKIISGGHAKEKGLVNLKKPAIIAGVIGCVGAVGFGLVILFLLFKPLAGGPLPSIPNKQPGFQKIIFTEPTVGLSTITLISDKEYEMKEGRSIVLGEYSRQENKLRIVTQSQGTTRVTYYDLTADGLRDSDSGDVFLLPEALNNWREQIRIAKEAEEERQRMKDEQRRAREQEIARKLLESKNPTKDFETYSCPVSTPNGNKTQEIKVTDVDVTFLDHYGNKMYKVWYGYISRVETSDDYILISLKSSVKEYGYASSMLVPFDTKEHRATIRQTVSNALDAWRARFPDGETRDRRRIMH